MRLESYTFALAVLVYCFDIAPRRRGTLVLSTAGSRPVRHQRSQSQIREPPSGGPTRKSTRTHTQLLQPGIGYTADSRHLYGRDAAHTVHGRGSPVHGPRAHRAVRGVCVLQAWSHCRRRRRHGLFDSTTSASAARGHTERNNGGLFDDNGRDRRTGARRRMPKC